jgi:hypothetical protein
MPLVAAEDSGHAWTHASAKPSKLGATGRHLNLDLLAGYCYFVLNMPDFAL